MFLCGHRHNYSRLLEQDVPDAALVQVRRAEEYIEANAQRAISAFALFRAFRKSRGYSPMEFANQVRLRHARELLRRADAVATVEAVAASCGFSDLGRFAEDYVRFFGEQPAQTLRSE